MASEHTLLSPKAEAPEVASVDPRILRARQIRQYIETAPVFHVLAVGVGVGITAGLILLYAPRAALYDPALGFGHRRTMRCAAG